MLLGDKDMANKIKKTNNKKDVKDSTTVMTTGNELVNLIKIVVIISAVLLVFYFITVIVEKKLNKHDYTIKDEVAVIQYDKIIVGEILNRTDSSYYVLVEKESDPYIDLYKTYLTTYSNTENSLRYYTVDLSDIFNRNSVADQNYVEGNDTSKYKFASTSLLKIENGELAAVYSDNESITQYLSNLIK